MDGRLIDAMVGFGVFATVFFWLARSPKPVPQPELSTNDDRPLTKAQIVDEYVNTFGRWCIARLVMDVIGYGINRQRFDELQGCHAREFAGSLTEIVEYHHGRLVLPPKESMGDDEISRLTIAIQEDPAFKVACASSLTFLCAVAGEAHAKSTLGIGSRGRLDEVIVCYAKARRDPRWADAQ